MFIVFIFGFVLNGFSQQMQDVVYLKDGSIIRGVIIEQVPNRSIKIQTNDGSIFVYKIEQIEKMTKENLNVPARTVRNGLYRSTPQFKFNNDHNGNKSGYKGFVDFGYTFGVGHVSDAGRLSLTTSHGVQINPYLFVGGGTTVNYYTSASYFSLPLFANVRGSFMDNSISPFVDLKIGYTIFDVTGFYFSPSIGCRFGLQNGNGVNVSLGYEMQKGTLEFDSYSTSVTVGGVALRVGYDF